MDKAQSQYTLQNLNDLHGAAHGSTAQNSTKNHQNPGLSGRLTRWLADRLPALRNRHFMLIDLLIICLTPTLALMLRLDSLQGLERYKPALLFYTGAALLVRLLIFYVYGLYRRYWSYVGLDDLITVGQAVALSTFMLLALWFSYALNSQMQWLETSLPRSILFIDTLLLLLLVASNRVAPRLARAFKQRDGQIEPQRVIIVGAGDAGAMIARELRETRARGPQWSLVGFVDDDLEKHDVYIYGVPVLSGCEKLPELIRSYSIQQVIIAMPQVAGKRVREIVQICEGAGITPQTVPSFPELLDGTIQVSQVRPVQIEDLLRREPVPTDLAAIREMLRDKRVLVTGGGGSIGSELCRQILRCQPAELSVVGHGENSIFEISQELGLLQPEEGHPPTIIRSWIADLRLADRLQYVLERVQPDVVFHAAAHKHVPLMENHPAEAITNNVLGTRNLLRSCLSVDVAHFVMISTDKAVNPTNVMGASKRTAELLVHQAAEKSGRPYVAVRFGNVLGSRGSVIHTFKRQIALGGPITVTHPEMNRYFMTIPEASQLVLQAGVLGKGGEVFVLDMGEPVRIVDLAQDLIRLSGLEVGRDIDLRFSGLRPGEKLYEELFLEGEAYNYTSHPKILLAANASHFVPADLDQHIEGLTTAARRNDRQAIVAGFQALIPEYQPFEETVGDGDGDGVREKKVEDMCGPLVGAWAWSPAG